MSDQHADDLVPAWRENPWAGSSKEPWGGPRRGGWSAQDRRNENRASQRDGTMMLDYTSLPAAILKHHLAAIQEAITMRENEEIEKKKLMEEEYEEKKRLIDKAEQKEQRETQLLHVLFENAVQTKNLVMFMKDQRDLFEKEMKDKDMVLARRVDHMEKNRKKGGEDKDKDKEQEDDGSSSYEDEEEDKNKEPEEKDEEPEAKVDLPPKRPPGMRPKMKPAKKHKK